VSFETSSMDKNTVLISGAIVFREQHGKTRWFVVKQGNGEEIWEIPKIMVRKGESSVRAALRMMGEKGGMTTRVLEEAGRAGGVVTLNNKILPQRHLYYLMLLKSGTKEAFGFGNYLWLEYANAVHKLSSKRERAMLKAARGVMETWKKERRNRRAKKESMLMP